MICVCDYCADEQFAAPVVGFAIVAEQMNLVSRVILAGEWISEGAYDEATGLLRDLEDELLDRLRYFDERAAA